MESIPDRRLLNQGITGPGKRRPADVVEWSGAVQAQEYEAAKWALGLRLQDDAVDAQVERAFDLGEILRTHVMRPTWHFVSPKDIRWLLELTAPRVRQAMGSILRQMELDARTLARAITVFERALGDAGQLTRKELSEHLRRARMPMTGLRLGLVVMLAEIEAVLCSGPRRGRQITYALLATRAPKTPRLDHDEALAELSLRYFRSHGPATLRDFIWWSGLKTADARRAIEMSKPRREEVDGQTYWSVDSKARPVRAHPVHLLPIYDEYMVAHRDREAVPHGPRLIGKSRKPVIFQHAVIIAGHVAGTWRTPPPGKVKAVDITPLRRLTALERSGLADAITRYERFRDY